LEVARVAGVLVSLLNTGSTDWSGPEALKTLPLRGWGEDFAQALQDGGWPGALVEVVGLVSAGLPQSAPGEVVDHLRLPRPVLLTLAVAEAVALAEEGARLARCKVGGHYFFAPGRGRLPGYCPLHGLVRRREAVRERVRAWRAKRRR
jgi:hypothetical protein